MSLITDNPDRALSLAHGKHTRRDRDILAARLAARLPFHNYGPTLTGGRTLPPNPEPLGWLDELDRYRATPSSLHAAVRDAYRQSLALADYVVRSYATPIAWHVPTRQHPLTGDAGQWVMPGDSSDIRWSPTTARHRSIIRLALATATDTGEVLFW